MHRKGEDDPPPQDGAANEAFFVLVPSISSKPSTGFSVGVSGNVAFYSGDPETTHISSVVGGAKGTQLGQLLTGVRLNVFTEDDRWFVQSDNRFSATSQETYGLGPSTTTSDQENWKYDYVRLYETAYKQVGKQLFVGGGFGVSRYSSIRPGSSANDEAAYVDYTTSHGFPLDHQTSGGTTLGVFYDSRTNAINSQSGWLASVTLRTYFDGFLGGDSTWQELYTDVRTYRKLTTDGRRRLAFWVWSDMVLGGVAPYFDLPETGGDSSGRSARGYAQGRFRGEKLVYGEVEYRDTLTRNGLVGFVAFLNTTTLSNSETGDRLFQGWAPGAGFGFRFLLNKRSRTNLCTDWGWGKDGSHGFYLSVQEAF